MWLDLNQSSVQKDDSKFVPMLSNLQANILKFHGRTFAHHLFFVIDDVDSTKHWLTEFASSTITSAKKQLDDSATFKVTRQDGGPVYTLSLSSSGFRKLGKKPDIDNDEPLDNGMQGSQTLLNDNRDDWEPELANQIDFLIIVADSDPTAAANAANKIVDQVQNFATLLKNQRGNVLKMRDTKVGIEHFSYADGISQPMYLADEIAGQNSKHPQFWDDQTDLIRVLVKENDSPIEDCFGSYLVFRKLEQRVKDFKDAEGDNGNTPGKRLIKVNGNPVNVKDDTGATNNDELAGAMIVGRYENSTPVTKTSVAFSPDPSENQVTNDFDYADDKAGLKCPFHAHIRLVNPRRGDPLETDFKALLEHRITRRAIPFDDHTAPADSSPDPDQRKRFDDDKVLDIEADQLELDNQPTDKVGLLFMCYQSNIANQFEILQGFWANQGFIGQPPVKGQDSLITQGTDLPRWLPQQWNKPLHSDNFQFSKFVTMRGGEYFYTPSIPFLKSLSTVAPNNYH